MKISEHADTEQRGDGFFRCGEKRRGACGGEAKSAVPEQGAAGEMERHYVSVGKVETVG